MNVVLDIRVTETDAYSYDALSEGKVEVSTENALCLPWAAICAGAVEKALHDAQAKLDEMEAEPVE